MGTVNLWAIFPPRKSAFPRHCTLDPSVPINTIGGQASTGNRPTSWGPDRGRLTLPALLPRTRRHPPPPLRSAPRLLHRTASPEGHRPAIRLQLQHPARRDLRLSHAVSSRPSSPLFAAPRSGRPRRDHGVFCITPRKGIFQALPGRG